MLNSLFKAVNKRNLHAWVVIVALMFPTFVNADWNSEWMSRNKITFSNTGATTSMPILVRLHSGNFDFTTVNIDGSDIRFVAADDKTELNYFIEKFDAVNELAVIWVKLPSIGPTEKTPYIWLYHENEKATTKSNSKVMADANTVANFHFGSSALLQSSSENNVQAAGDISVQKAGLIGDSAVFNGKPVIIASNPSFKHVVGTGFTWSAWIKPSSLPQTASLYSQGDNVAFKIEEQKLSLNIGIGLVSGGELKPGLWQHVAFSLDKGKANIFVNGLLVGSGDVPDIEVEQEIKIGEGYLGELDEMLITNVAQNASTLKLIVDSQGVDSALLQVIAAEGGEEASEEGEANYMSILINSLTLDAKVVIGILAVMFAISAWVMVRKAILVSKTDRDNKKFLARFQAANAETLLTLDKNVEYKNSTLFKLYQAGLREIKKRESAGESLTLSGASMDAIKAAIDADLVRETQHQNAGMVLLTIAISGGPFLGLLGTVVGVMITFAAIAAAGDVNVNAIAPGIAAALLATVAGLGVAIPALFGYNYLASRIKNITIAMQIFVDEFVTRTAELFGKE